MPGRDFSNLRAVVNDLVSRQAKFGSFNASVDALKKKYDHDDNDRADKPVVYFKSKKDGRDVACINRNESAITDFTTKVDHFTYCTDHQTSKFVEMCADDRLSDTQYRIYDTNRNGYVDKDDKIEIRDYYAPDKPERKPIIQTIAEFLGL